MTVQSCCAFINSQMSVCGKFGKRKEKADTNLVPPPLEFGHMYMLDRTIFQQPGASCGRCSYLSIYIEKDTTAEFDVNI